MSVLPIFYGQSRPLGPLDFQNAAKTIDVEEAALKAIVSVETGNSVPFNKDKLMPVLYEAHIAYRLNGHKLVPKLAVVKWDRTLYSATTYGEYERLSAAAALNTIGYDVALQSASYGLPQILGMNFEMCGYQSVETFVKAMADSALNQLESLCAFLQAKHLIGAIRKRDWATVAAGYNGPDYAANQYDIKLSAAYRAAVSQISARDAGKTVLMPAITDETVMKIGDTGDGVKTLQAILRSLGFPLVVDGKFGKMTETAIKTLQDRNRLAATGTLSIEQARTLQ